MIELTLRDIVNTVDIFNRLSQESVPAKTAYKIFNIINELEKQYTFYDEKRLELVDKYGQRDEAGALVTNETNYLIDPMFSENFTNEFNALLEIKVQLDTEPFTKDELNDVRFSAREIMLLNPFIK